MEAEMSPKTEGAIVIAAAVFVLLSAIIAPPFAAGLAVLFLVALAGYKFLKKA
jgi:hypothetical protein